MEEIETLSERWSTMMPEKWLVGLDEKDSLHKNTGPHRSYVTITTNLHGNVVSYH